LKASFRGRYEWVRLERLGRVGFERGRRFIVRGNYVGRFDVRVTGFTELSRVLIWFVV
jgi:hypothetical protein